MNQKYNRQIHLELLKYKHSIEKQGKYLPIEDPEKDLALLKYSVIMNSHIHWENSDQYLKLMENFVHERISGSDFENQFLKIYNAVHDVSDLLEENLILLHPNEKADGFYLLTEDAFSACESFNPDPESQDRFTINEVKLRYGAGVILREMKAFSKPANLITPPKNYFLETSLVLIGVQFLLSQYIQ